MDIQLYSLKWTSGLNAFSKQKDSINMPTDEFTLNSIINSVYISFKLLEFIIFSFRWHYIICEEFYAYEHTNYNLYRNLL